MGSFRLAEVLAGLSLASDLGMGGPPDQALRVCVLATRLAERLDLPAAGAADVYYAGLLQHVGCTGDAFDLAAAFGDDLVAHRAGSRTDFSRPADVLRMYIPEVARGRTRAERVRLLSVMMVRGQRIGELAQRADCEVASAKRAGWGCRPPRSRRCWRCSSGGTARACPSGYG